MTFHLGWISEEAVTTGVGSYIALGDLVVTTPVLDISATGGHSVAVTGGLSVTVVNDEVEVQADDDSVTI